MRTFIGITPLIQLYLLGAWLTNVYQLTQLDFGPDYKAEIVRSLGVVTPICAVTVWMDIGEEKQVSSNE